MTAAFSPCGTDWRIGQRTSPLCTCAAFAAPVAPYIMLAGDTRKLLDDCAVLRPTVFCAVPRVYERIYSGVMDKVGGRPGNQNICFTVLRASASLVS